MMTTYLNEYEAYYLKETTLALGKKLALDQESWGHEVIPNELRLLGMPDRQKD